MPKEPPSSPPATLPPNGRSAEGGRDDASPPLGERQRALGEVAAPKKARAEGGSDLKDPQAAARPQGAQSPPTKS